MATLEEAGPAAAEDVGGWSRPGWRAFRGLFRAVLKLPAPILRALSAGLPVPAADAPLDPRARFHAWFVTRWRRPAPADHRQARRPRLLSLALLEGPPETGVAFTDLTIGTPAGAIGGRLYRPASAPHTNAPLLVYLHFGGCVIGDLESCHTACSIIAARAGCLVLSAAYRLAPEHRFPAAVEDAVAAYAWARLSAARLGADPERIAIGGDSAGGYLAAAACLSLRDQGRTPPKLQLLIYPVTDMARRSTPATPFDDSYPLDRADLIWFCDLYLRDERDADDPLCSIGRASRLAGLPPTILVQSGHDLLFDEGAAFGRRLADERVPVRRLVYPTLPHGFTAMSGGVPRARAALVEIAETLAELLDDGGPPPQPTGETA